MNVIFQDENSQALGTPFRRSDGKPSETLSARKPLGNITNSSLRHGQPGNAQKDASFQKLGALPSASARPKPSTWWAEKAKPVDTKATQAQRSRLDILCDNPPEKAFGMTWEDQELSRVRAIEAEVSSSWRKTVQSWKRPAPAAPSAWWPGSMLDEPALLPSPSCSPVRTGASQEHCLEDLEKLLPEVDCELDPNILNVQGLEEDWDGSDCAGQACPPGSP